MNRRHILRMAGATGLGLAGNFLPKPVMAAARVFDADYFRKMHKFEYDHPTDLLINGADLALLERVAGHLKRVQRTVGYGNFHLLGFDYMLKIARNYSRVQRFSRDELEFIERVFYQDATVYGFYGEKVSGRLTEIVPRRAMVKIRGSGQYIYRGKPEATYHSLRREVGKKLILSSGVRGVVKQLYLFLDKARRSQGNLSRASRSLAPPGYSFHGIGDFDVGQRGYGKLNFTRTFAKSEVYRRLGELGYLRVRYPDGNLKGVRYEPWHIKVT